MGKQDIWKIKSEDIWLVVYVPLWNIWVNGKDDIPYSMENKSHVPNHQPHFQVKISLFVLFSCDKSCYINQYRTPRQQGSKIMASWEKNRTKWRCYEFLMGEWSINGRGVTLPPLIIGGYYTQVGQQGAQNTAPTLQNVNISNHVQDSTCQTWRFVLSMVMLARNHFIGGTYHI